MEAGGTTAADVPELTGGVGMDVSIEAVGYRPGGTIGVHGVPVSLRMQDM